MQNSAQPHTKKILIFWCPYGYGPKEKSIYPEKTSSGLLEMYTAVEHMQYDFPSGYVVYLLFSREPSKTVPFFSKPKKTKKKQKKRNKQQHFLGTSVHIMCLVESKSALAPLSLSVCPPTSSTFFLPPSSLLLALSLSQTCKASPPWHSRQLDYSAKEKHMYRLSKHILTSHTSSEKTLRPKAQACKMNVNAK